MELHYRVVVGVLYFGQMLALMIFYRRTNNRQVFYAEREPPVIAGIRGFWAIGIIVSIALYLVFPTTVRWGYIALPPVIRYGGMLGGILSDALILWVLLALGKNISATLQIHAHHRLVTEGPYRYVRHPLYSAGILLFGSLGLIASNWFLAGLGIGFQIFLVLVRTPAEERMLLDHFGEAYQRYLEQTGALFPSLGWRKI